MKVVDRLTKFAFISFSLNEIVYYMYSNYAYVHVCTHMFSNVSYVRDTQLVFRIIYIAFDNVVDTICFLRHSPLLV